MCLVPGLPLPSSARWFTWQGAWAWPGERRAYADYGLHLDRKWWLDLGFGLGLGVFLMTAIVLTMTAFGWASLTLTAITDTGLPFLVAFLVKILVYIAVGVNEELVFRGY